MTEADKTNSALSGVLDLDEASKTGHFHPITQTINEIVKIFAELGFQVTEGPEIETEFNNFDALNVPKDHTSRDMQDTFWLKDSGGDITENKSPIGKAGERLLPRTHTSPVQIRFMQNNKPPFRIICPGKVFRNEATDATHEAEFFQVEGMYIDKTVSVANLKFTLETFVKKFFGENTEMRFRPSYFPFVEPGFEIDIKWKDRWLEVLGAGLVRPEVLRAGGINPDEWSGFAFGMGLDRLVMLKYGIDDIRNMYSGDLRFVNQF